MAVLLYAVGGGIIEVSICPIAPEQEKAAISGLLRSRTFWFLVLLMVCAGAGEQGMSQWASAFAEAALRLPKTAGDLAGPCCFALFMGTARALYGKFSDLVPLKEAMAFCAVLCVGCYALAVFAPYPLLGWWAAPCAAFPWVSFGRGRSAWRQKPCPPGERLCTP